MMDKTYSRDICPEACDVDVNDNWKIASIFRVLQEISNLQTIIWGCDRNTLKAKYGLCYVLIRMNIHMDILPGSGDNVCVTTWPDHKKKLLFTRYYSFKDRDGRVLGNAVSQWALMNLETRSMVSPGDYVNGPDTSDIPPSMVMPRGFNISANLDREEYRKPSYSDLDYNRHVNNTRYVEWACDTLPPKAFEHGKITDFDIKYHHEISLESIAEQEIKEVRLECGYDDPTGEFACKGYDSGNVLIFEAKGNILPCKI